MFTGYYLPYVSGQTIYVQRLAEGLVRRGHAVTILCAHHQKDTPLQETVNGVRVVRSRVLCRVRKGAIMPLVWHDLRRLLRHHDLFHRHVPGLLDAYVSLRLACASPAWGSWFARTTRWASPAPWPPCSATRSATPRLTVTRSATPTCSSTLDRTLDAYERLYARLASCGAHSPASR